MSKVVKGKGKTRGKNRKTTKAEEQDNKSTYSFQNYDSRRYFYVFVLRLVLA